MKVFLVLMVFVFIDGIKNIYQFSTHKNANKDLDSGKDFLGGKNVKS